MTIQPATQPHGREGTIIPARRESVTVLCTHTFLAALAALALRLVFVHWFATTTDDSATYLQLANNWVDHHVYGLSQNGQIVPTDLRTPGYPRVWIIALWLAATCPFVANYSAVVLTEVVVTFLATAALACFALGLRQEPARLGLRIGDHWNLTFAFALLGCLLTGAATLVRPEMPLLLAAAVLVYGLRAWSPLGGRKSILFVAAMTGAFLLPLVPWAARNAVSLHKLQFLAPRYATFPGEYASVGYYAWTGTWLERYRDVYFTVWKIGEERADVNELPASAFDRVPFERALTIWFTPRTELLPIDGKFWPLREQWEDSHADVLVTGGFAVLGYLYIALAIGGVWLAWQKRRESGATGQPFRPNFWGLALLLAYFLVRTAFLTTVEAPEPRYVVSCYPGILALIAMLGVRKGPREEALEGSNASL